MQTVDVPAGGGGVFDVKIDEEGLYPFVSHSFASVDMGQVGLLKVGNPKGTMSPLDANRARLKPRPRPLSCATPSVQQAVDERVADELGPGAEAELLHDVRAVRLGGAHRDEERLRDLLVRVAERQQPQHLALAVGERIARRPARASTSACASRAPSVGWT